MPSVNVGDRVEVCGRRGEVVSYWVDADAARRRNDNGHRVAVVLDDGTVLADVGESALSPVSEE